MNVNLSVGELISVFDALAKAAARHEAEAAAPGTRFVREHDDKARAMRTLYSKLAVAFPSVHRMST